MKITKLVLMRHGESKWNKKNLFTGWTDIDLSIKGRKEAKNAGLLLKEKKIFFDISYTSLLKRAIHSLYIILNELDQNWIPIIKSWYLNEKHYGSLQGLNKEKIIKKYGYKKVFNWRRSFDVAPPPLCNNNIHYNNFSMLNKIPSPQTESLKDTYIRVLKYWNTVIFPKIKLGNQILIVAHGNTIRAIRKFLDNLDEKQITNLEIPTGIPLIYELNKKYNPIKYYYLKN